MSLTKPPESDDITSLKDHSDLDEVIAEMEDGSLFRKGEQTHLLLKLIPSLNRSEVDRRLHEFTPEQMTHFRMADMGSLAFDIVFSPGIIPKNSQPAYRIAYQTYFNQIYGLEIFDQEGQFIFPEITDVLPEVEERRRQDQLIVEWIANLRAVEYMRRSLIGAFEFEQLVTNNLTEAVLCRMAENGERWPEELFSNLPVASEIRLDELRQEVDKKRLQGYVLAPGQFFRAANLLEFQEKDVLRQYQEKRRATIMDMVEEAAQSKRTSSTPPPSSVLPPQSTILSYVQAGPMSGFSPRQNRAVLMSSLMNRPEHVRKWAKLLLGNANGLK